jgi:hypothetical protein
MAAISLWMAGLCILLAGCTPQDKTAEPIPAVVTVHEETPASSPSPVISEPQVSPLTLVPGDLYFRLDGRPGPVFMQNVAGIEYTDYQNVLGLMKKGGSKLARFQLDSLGMGYTISGRIDEVWVRKWERIFDRTRADGIYAVLVFSGWFDWNDGSPDYDYSMWKTNPLNAAIGGPAGTPSELFQKDSPTQKLWLAWVKELVTRWRGRQEIAAWEIFSEVNIASGVNEAKGVAFIEDAAAVIRETDPTGRPVTASLADASEWQSFYQSEAIDFVNIHPYPTSGQLDRYIIQSVHQKLTDYGKPVLIGEAGLSAVAPNRDSSTLTTTENASIGIRHAIWAGLVSGAMNGRGLYWEDSFGLYFPELGLPFIEKYAGYELAPARFAAAVDFSGFRPAQVTLSSGIIGAVVGNERSAIGWVRDAGCEPPDWKLNENVTGQSVVVSLPGENAVWQVDFYDTHTGSDIIGSDILTRNGRNIVILIPDFSDDIAFRMTATD